MIDANRRPPHGRGVASITIITASNVRRMFSSRYSSVMAAKTRAKRLLMVNPCRWGKSYCGVAAFAVVSGGYMGRVLPPRRVPVVAT